jgi:hypothetical protein
MRIGTSNRIRVRLELLLILILLAGSSALGQGNPNDPLDPMYLPSVDQKAADYPANVWVTSSLAKVHQDSATPGSVKWAQLSAARNEFVSFQVHEQAGSSPITLNVSISDLVNAKTGTHISSSSIIVYREGYINIATLSDANGSTGLTPDILIPAVDPYRHEARNAFPFTIAANQTQSAWFDVFVPPNAPSGYYQGTVTVTNGGSTYTTLPVLLSVWNFTLPSTATLKSVYGTAWDTCFGYYGDVVPDCGKYPGASGNTDLGAALSDVDAAVMMLDHRTSAAQVSPLVLNSPPNNWTQFDSLFGPLLNGTPANTRTILSGAALNEMVYMSASNITIIPGNAQDWITHFVSKGWQSKLLGWAVDEPSVCGGWTVVIADATYFHGTTPPITAMTTSDIANATTCDGLNSVDIITPTVGQMEHQGSQNRSSAFGAWLGGKSGRQVWMYQSCNSHGSCGNGTSGDATNTWPSVMLDATPVRNRIMQWIEWMDNATGDLYYDTEYCWYSTCADGRGNTGVDPWTYIYYSGGNGDGTLIYPGAVSKIGGTTPIPLPSIRLKNIRDGYQDYEYLRALTNAGLGSFATAEVQSFITNAYTFNNDPTALLGARTALGNKLHQLSLATAVHPPPSLTIQQVK